MFNNKKILAAAGAGLALYAAYKYSKMSETEKNDLHNSLKEKGKSLAEKWLPDNLKEKFNEVKGNFKPEF
ncbi:MAG: hypothetical protein ABIP30_03190 [Ferruginibacter sp.]